MIQKETITFDEFRAWLTGMIVGKRGALPDLDDWKQIKAMLDKVVQPAPPLLQPAPVQPNYPTYPTYPTYPQPFSVPNTEPYPYGYGTWCDTWSTSSSVALTGTSEITIGDPPGSVSDSITVSIPEQMELGLMGVSLSNADIDEQSKQLGEELNRMIQEVENGQKKSS